MRRGCLSWGLTRIALLESRVTIYTLRSFFEPYLQGTAVRFQNFRIILVVGDCIVLYRSNQKYTPGNLLEQGYLDTKGLMVRGGNKTSECPVPFFRCC